jgi:hypothetical protein
MYSASGLLPDEVWAQLDPSAGHLAPETKRRVRIGALVTFGALVAVLMLWRSGAVVPAVGLNGGGGAMSGPGVLSVSFDVQNRGLASVRVVGVGRSGPGLRLTHVDGQLPVELHSGDAAGYTLYYDVTDCAATPSGHWGVPVRIDRPWGVVTTWVRPDPMVPMGASSPTAATSEEWQAALATMTCTPHAAPA